MKMYEDCKHKTNAVLNQFKTITLPKNLTVLEAGAVLETTDSFELNHFIKQKL